MQIRALTSADAHAFRALRREGLVESPHAFSESAAEHDRFSAPAYATRFGAAIANDNFIIGVFDDSGALIGCCCLSRNTGEKTLHKATVWGVYLEPEARGSGAAKAMFGELIRRARSINGLEQIKLGVRTGQNAARKLYLSMGFEPWGLERRSIKVAGEYIDEDAMVLFL